MEYINKINSQLNSPHGMITSKYCDENNIPRVYLSRLVKKGEIKKVHDGIYITQNGDFDLLYFLQQRNKKIIYSYYTALDLLGITNVISHKTEVTVYKGYKVRNDIADNIKIHYVKKEIHDLGVIDVETIFGNKVKTYCFERVFCDFVLNRDKVDAEVFRKVVREYSEYEHQDIYLLNKIATKMNILKKVSDILQIISNYE